MPRLLSRFSYLLATALLALPEWSLLAAPATPTERQMHLLSSNCVQCHARPGIGAPLMGSPADWKERQAQGEEVLLRHVIEGKGGMPPLGYCSACDEEDFRVLIRLILPNTQVQP
jgi:cytochrome c5